MADIGDSTVKVNETGTKIETIRNMASSPKKILSLIGVYLVKTTSAAFRLQKRGPHSWEPRRVPNVAGILRDLDKGPSIPSRRFEGTPALMDTGRLRGSFTWRFYSSTSIMFGTNVPYANVHQTGGDSEIVVTSTMRENLATLLRRNRGVIKRVQKAGGRDAYWHKKASDEYTKWKTRNPMATKAALADARKKIYQKAEASTTRKAGQAQMLSGLGWIFSYHAGDVVTFRVKARPMVGFWEEDKKEMDKIIRRVFVEGA